MLVVGFEGVWGLLAWAVLLPAFQFIPCDLSSICTNGVVEDTAGVFRDYAANPIQIVYSVCMVFLVTFLNVSGVSVTKYGSSAQRTTCDIMRNLFTWVFLMIVPINGELLEKFNPVQLGGFLIVTTGVLVYNEIVVIPFFGFGDNTKIKIEQRERMKIDIDHVDKYREAPREDGILEEDTKRLY